MIQRRRRKFRSVKTTSRLFQLKTTLNLQVGLSNVNNPKISIRYRLESNLVSDEAVFETLIISKKTVMQNAEPLESHKKIKNFIEKPKQPESDFLQGNLQQVTKKKKKQNDAEVTMSFVHQQQQKIQQQQQQKSLQQQQLKQQTEVEGLKHLLSRKEAQLQKGLSFLLLFFIL